MYIYFRVLIIIISSSFFFLFYLCILLTYILTVITIYVTFLHTHTQRLLICYWLWNHCGIPLLQQGWVLGLPSSPQAPTCNLISSALQLPHNDPHPPQNGHSLTAVCHLPKNNMISHIHTRCFTTLGHNCTRWFPRSLWSKKVHINMCPILHSYGVMTIF